MTQRGRDRRLSAQDASFLYFEKKESPLHIGSIAVFEGHVDYERFVENIAAKINLIPRYQQIVDARSVQHRPPDVGVGPRVRYPPAHLRRRRWRRPGTDEQLFELAADAVRPDAGPRQAALGDVS